MKVLFVCHQVPYPPDKGEKIRAYYHLLHLARSHRVHLACLAGSPADLGHARHLEGLCASVDVVPRARSMTRLSSLKALPGKGSLSVAAYDSPALRARVRRRFTEVRPDVVVAYSTPMAPYAEPGKGAPRVLDFVDADSEKWRAYGRLHRFPLSWIYALEADRLARFEARQAAEFDASVFVSRTEADIVRRLAPESELSVVPLGVDVERFQPAGAGHPPGPVMAFIGVMNYFPNVDAVTHFAEDILPRVRAEVPGAEFRIVGRDPSGAVRRLARLPGVVVTGSVPDVRPHLAQAALGVAPFRISRGAQSKVLEAMASGLPVVGTPVAFQGLALKGDAGVRAADSAEAFAREVVVLLRDPDLRRDMGARARRYVEEHHGWEGIGAMFESLLVGVVEARRERAGVTR